MEKEENKHLSPVTFIFSGWIKKVAYSREVKRRFHKKGDKRASSPCAIP